MQRIFSILKIFSAYFPARCKKTLHPTHERIAVACRLHLREKKVKIMNAFYRQPCIKCFWLAKILNLYLRPWRQTAFRVDWLMTRPRCWCWHCYVVVVVVVVVVICNINVMSPRAGVAVSWVARSFVINGCQTLLTIAVNHLFKHKRTPFAANHVHFENAQF